MILRTLMIAGLTLWAGSAANACCAVSRRGQAAVNADQKVILLYDQANQTQHFIRQANFKSEGESLGFLVPTPTRPQLEASGHSAFPYLAAITAPKEPVSLSIPLGCAAVSTVSYGSVRVIEEKTVAGYETVVLAADSGKALIAWLNDHGYAYTKEAAAWAEPYMATGWFMTAMKLAKGKQDSSKERAGLAAAALRITFKTERPLFPYREPDSREAAASLGVTQRLLRIYFVAEARYEGHFPSGQAWSGKTRWSQPLGDGQRRNLLQKLQLPESTGPSELWLTEFTDDWPYGVAPGDIYFKPAAFQRKIGAAHAPVTLDPLLPSLLGIGLIRPWRKRRPQSS